MQPDRHGFRKHGLTDDAIEDADRGNPDLDGGQETGRLVVELVGDRGGTVAILGQSRQAPGMAPSPWAAASNASVNWVTIRCARRWSAGNASLALATSPARAPVGMATLVSGAVM